MTYSISGYVRDNLGNALSGAVVALSGSTIGSVLSAANGSYQFTNLANSKSYTVTPADPGYIFTPVYISTSSLAANLSNQNFVGASTMTYYIGGYVRDNAGNAVTGATMSLNGSATGTMSCGDDGSYQFSNLANGKNYTVTPSKTGYNFTPVYISTSSLAANMNNQNFTAAVSSPASYYVRGYTIDSLGNGISGILVALTGNVSMSTSTPANGLYQFTNLPGNAAYAITPAKTGLVFSPGAINISSLSANLDNQNFAVANTYTIGGYVYDTRGSGIGGVSVALSGNMNANTVTGNNGSYNFSGVPAVGSYVVAPSQPNYGCTPASLNFSNLSNNLTNANFTCKRRYYIRGNVAGSNGVAIVKAAVTLTGGQTSAAVTDVNGNYEFDDLDENSSYNITVIKDGYLFNPASRSTSTLSGALENWNFTGAYLKSMSAGDIKIIGSLKGKGTINPDNGDTAKIYFIAADIGVVSLSIYTLSGEVVWSDSINGLKEGVFEWVPKNIASGTYVAHVKGPGINKSKKIIIIR